MVRRHIAHPPVKHLVSYLVINPLPSGCQQYHLTTFLSPKRDQTELEHKGLFHQLLQSGCFVSIFPTKATSASKAFKAQPLEKNSVHPKLQLLSIIQLLFCCEHIQIISF